jgi:hypothetical protein
VSCTSSDSLALTAFSQRSSLISSKVVSLSLSLSLSLSDTAHQFYSRSSGGTTGAEWRPLTHCSSSSAPCTAWACLAARFSTALILTCVVVSDSGALAMHCLHRNSCSHSACSARNSHSQSLLCCCPCRFVLQDCLRRHPEVLDDLHKADEGLALPSAAR